MKPRYGDGDLAPELLTRTWCRTKNLDFRLGAKSLNAHPAIMPIFLVEKKWVEERAERQSGTEMGYSLQSEKQC